MMNKTTKYLLFYFTSMTGMISLASNGGNIWTDGSGTSENQLTLPLGEIM